MEKTSDRLASEGLKMFCTAGLCLTCVKFDASQKESKKTEGKACPYDSVGG